MKAPLKALMRYTATQELKRAQDFDADTITSAPLARSRRALAIEAVYDAYRRRQPPLPHEKCRRAYFCAAILASRHASAPSAI